MFQTFRVENANLPGYTVCTTQICTKCINLWNLNHHIKVGVEHISVAMQQSGRYYTVAGVDPGFCEGGFERGFVDSLKGTFEQK